MFRKIEHLFHISGVSRLSALLLFLVPVIVCAQEETLKKGSSKANRYASLPAGYSQVGSTKLYYKQTSNGIDMIGFYEGYYYSSTFGDNGYKLSVKVGNYNAARVNCLNGTTSYGVKVMPSVEQQGELARICYSVTNTTESDVSVSLGTHADVMIGSNDMAPISRRIDTFGETYGLTMMDGNGAQLCLLFGAGLAGVTPVSDFWFGAYNLNNSTSVMVGNYSSGSHYMEENGSYDSGMGWCWKDQPIAVGSTVVFSYLIGVGEVNLEPYSSFEVSPDDPEGWNDLHRPHRLTLDGTYESPAGLEGVIEYAVEDSEEWTALTDTLESGETFSESLVATFNPNRPVHIIRLRTMDLVGNTTLLLPIEYIDMGFCLVGGIEDMTYTGDSLFQNNLTCELDAEDYTVGNYSNNVNVGVASFTVEGVFPKTIGRKGYTFNVVPQPLSGGLVLAETEFVYTGSTFTPAWQFSNANYRNLKAGEDYTAEWTDNKLPGTGTLTVTGKNNYTAALTADIYIDKAPLNGSLYNYTLPAEKLVYDEQSHGATVIVRSGVGRATITYLNEESGAETQQAPSLPGVYKIFLTIAEGTLYHGIGKTEIGTITIQLYDTEQYALIGQMATDTETYHLYYGMRMKLAQFLTSSSDVLEGGDLPSIHQTFMQMESLLTEAQTSVEQYNLLANLISYAGQMQEAYGELFTDEIKARVAATITNLQTAYNSGALTGEQIYQVWPQLQEKMRTELTECLTPYIDRANELIALGVIEDIHKRFVQAVQEVQSLLTWQEYNVEDAAYAKTLRTTILGIAAEAQANVKDLVLLRQAYTALGGAEKLSGTWQLETAPYRLTGVTFTEGQATKVTILGKNLTGNIPVEFFMLPKLNTLNLSYNNMSGDICQIFEQVSDLQDLQETCPITTLNISNNKLSGNIGQFAYWLGNLKNLNASSNCFEEVNPMISTKVTSLNLGKQTISRVVPLHLSKVTSEDYIFANVPNILLYNHANQTYTPNIKLSCTTPDNSWSMTLACQDGQLSVSSTSGGNTYYGGNGEVMNAVVLLSNGTREGTTFPITFGFDEGDGNFDGQVNVLDLQTMLNFIFEEYKNKPFNFTASNLWNDEIINVQDAVSLVNLLLDTEVSAVNMARRARREASSDIESEASVSVEDGLLTINSAVPVSAFDIVVSTEESCEALSSLNEMGFTCCIKRGGGQVHIVGYSLNGATLPIGSNAICRLTEGTVDYAMLSDREAQKITTVSNGTATGLQSLTGNLQSAHEVYRIPLGARRYIIIDSTGKKTMIKDEK